MMTKNSTVVKLDLLKNNITTDGASVLAKALEKNITLQSLSLGSNQVSGAMNDIAKLISFNAGLEELFLHRNPIFPNSSATREPTDR